MGPTHLDSYFFGKVDSQAMSTLGLYSTRIEEKGRELDEARQRLADSTSLNVESQAKEIEAMLSRACRLSEDLVRIESERDAFVTQLLETLHK